MHYRNVKSDEISQSRTWQVTFLISQLRSIFDIFHIAPLISSLIFKRQFTAANSYQILKRWQKRQVILYSKVKESEAITQSCPALYAPDGSALLEFLQLWIFQARRILEWAAIFHSSKRVIIIIVKCHNYLYY